MKNKSEKDFLEAWGTSLSIRNMNLSDNNVMVIPVVSGSLDVGSEENRHLDRSSVVALPENRDRKVMGKPV